MPTDLNKDKLLDVGIKNTNLAILVGLVLYLTELCLCWQPQAVGVPWHVW